MYKLSFSDSKLLFIHNVSFQCGDKHGAAFSFPYSECHPPIRVLRKSGEPGNCWKCIFRGMLTRWSECSAAQPGDLYCLLWLWYLYSRWSHLPQTQNQKFGEKEGRMVMDDIKCYLMIIKWIGGKFFLLSCEPIAETRRLQKEAELGWGT